MSYSETQPPSSVLICVSSSDINALKESSNITSSSFTESGIAMTTHVADELSKVNGFNSQSVETNGLITESKDLLRLSESNGVYPALEDARLVDAADSLNPPMSKAQLHEGSTIQQPIADIRQTFDPVAIVPTMNDSLGSGREANTAAVTELASTNAVSHRGDLEADVDMSSEPEPSLIVEGPIDTSVSLKAPPRVEEVDLPHHPPVPTIGGEGLEAPLDPLATSVDDGRQSVPVEEHRLASTNAELQSSSPDHIMQDVPLSIGKVSRGREEEGDEDAPATKRMKGKEDGSQVSEFKVPSIPQPTSDIITSSNPLDTTEQATASPIQTQESSSSSTKSSLPITTAQHRYLTKGVQSLKRSTAASSFVAPVDHVLLKIPTYPDIVKKPMDLKTMEENLKTDNYPSVDAYISDFNQIVENSVMFNGPEHAVTKAALALKASFDKHMSNLPSADITEPARPVKREKSVTSSAAPKSAPSRRESRSTLPKPKTPISASSPQTFALGPQGVPLIRRDSTVQDGRPKREIHPPAPRDLPYSNQKPKKKKYLWELKFCQEVLNEMKKPKYGNVGYPFYNPVDPVALNIPTYHKMIKKPMDLSTIESKLKGGQYENAKEFVEDMKLMFENCFRFNPDGDSVNLMGKEFQKVFDAEWAKKKNWIESHTPTSGLQSPGTSPEPDDEDEEEEEEEEEEENEISILQKQIAAMSEQVALIQKKKASPPVVTKKAAKGSKSTKTQSKKSGTTAVAKSEPKNMSKSTKKAKTPYVTYEQKQDISNRINMLNENNMQRALSIIRKNMPNLKVSLHTRLQRV